MVTHLLLLTIKAFFQKWKGLLITLFVSVIAGVIAEMLIRGKGFGLLFTIILGLVGGVVGNFLFKDLLNLTHNALIDSIIRSTAGAILLAVLVNLVIGSRNTKGYK